MLLCLNCYKVYNQKTIKNNMCKVKDCYGDVVEVDELFVPIIAELNRKGYETRYCCSGHVAGNGGLHSYIYFEDYTSLPCLPEGYKHDQDMYPHIKFDEGKVSILRYFDEKLSLMELSKQLYKNAIVVLEWVEGLEEYNKKDGGIIN